MLRSAMMLRPQAAMMLRPSQVGSMMVVNRQSSSTAGSTPPYTERQNKSGRPLSPHVTIYDWPVATVSSVTNRLTGVGLMAGMYSIGALALIGVDVPYVMHFLGSYPTFGPIAKAIVAFPFSYHYLGAVRHIMWDFNPSLLNNEKVEKSSYIVFAGTGLATVLAALL